MKEYNDFKFINFKASWIKRRIRGRGRAFREKIKITLIQILGVICGMSLGIIICLNIEETLLEFWNILGH